MTKTAEAYRTFNMRIDRDLFMFIKKHSFEQECTMTDIVSKLLCDYKKRVEKKKLEDK